MDNNLGTLGSDDVLKLFKSLADLAKLMADDWLPKLVMSLPPSTLSDIAQACDETSSSLRCLNKLCQLAENKITVDQEDRESGRGLDPKTPLEQIMKKIKNSFDGSKPRTIPQYCGFCDAVIDGNSFEDHCAEPEHASRTKNVCERKRDFCSVCSLCVYSTPEHVATILNSVEHKLLDAAVKSKEGRNIDDSRSSVSAGDSHKSKKLVKHESRVQKRFVRLSFQIKNMLQTNYQIEKFYCVLCSSWFEPRNVSSIHRRGHEQAQAGKHFELANYRCLICEFVVVSVLRLGLEYMMHHLRVCHGVTDEKKVTECLEIDEGENKRGSKIEEGRPPVTPVRSQNFYESRTNRDSRDRPRSSQIRDRDPPLSRTSSESNVGVVNYMGVSIYREFVKLCSDWRPERSYIYCLPCNEYYYSEKSWLAHCRVTKHLGKLNNRKFQNVLCRCSHCKLGVIASRSISIDYMKYHSHICHSVDAQQFAVGRDFEIITENSRTITYASFFPGANRNERRGFPFSSAPVQHNVELPPSKSSSRRTSMSSDFPIENPSSEESSDSDGFSSVSSEECEAARGNVEGADLSSDLDTLMRQLREVNYRRGVNKLVSK